MRPRTLVVAAATALVLAACGDTDEEPDQDATATTQEEDADENGEGIDVTQEDEDRAQVETDDFAADAGVGSLPEDWPEELALPDVPDLEITLATIVESGDERVLQANLTFPGDLDDARTYFEGLAGAGFEVEITEDLDAPLPRIDAEVDGNGWAGTITAQEGPTIIVDYQMQGS